MFIDYLKVHVKAGDGGSGRINFRREKFVPRGGPDGGDGGKGGSVIFEVDSKLGTLLDLKYHPNIEAKRGGDGGTNNCFGPDGQSVVVRVPLGTVVSDEAGRQLADLTEPGQRWVAAKGGMGGLGNTHFATPTNKTPRYAQPGTEGQERTLILELKLLADVGLVGLPNAGKSTLLSKLTAATPKIAPYPFTTLSPNLGVMEFEDLTHMTLADIPGLIEGASRGVGLGDRFLRHIERTKVLAHLVGDEQGLFDPEDMLYKYDLVCEELAAYSPLLARKRQLVIVTKTDLADPDDVAQTLAAFRERGIEPLTISAFSGEGLDALRQALRELVEAEEERLLLEPQTPEGETDLEEDFEDEEEDWSEEDDEEDEFEDEGSGEDEEDLDEDDSSDDFEDEDDSGDEEFEEGDDEDDLPPPPKPGKNTRRG
jgi:GTP-binding protein